MPGYVIHIATAKEYLRKHKNIEDEEEFIKGTIFPDFTTNKATTHYGKSSGFTNINKFLDKNQINNSFNKGYFLHLVTDYLFYNYYLDKFSKDIYNDYDIINKRLMEKYDINLPFEVKDKVFFKEGKTKILSYELACKVIDEISNYNLEAIAKESKEEKWNTYKNI